VLCALDARYALAMATPSRTLEAEIDRLYQVPLDEFTSARNALAKEAGPDASRVKALVKPPVAAWAVNQLFWQNRDAWDALIAAADNARRAHKAVLSGRSGDVRAASKVHDDAVEASLKETLALLTKAGHPVTDATKQAIVTTLRALPGDESPGRLTRVLQPGGFEALAGLSIARGSAAAPPKPAPVRRAAPATTASRPKVDAKALTRAREAAASAARALRDAEQAARREEFEIARAAREEERAEKAVEESRDALARAKTDLAEAEAALVTATRRREAAEARAKDVKHELTGARTRAAAADADLKKEEKGYNSESKSRREP
jgi:hypothetical protein